MSCKESNYDLIGAITAYPHDSLSTVRPFLQEKKYISPSDISYTDNRKTVIPMKRETGSLKETVTRDAAGDHYEVTVTCDVEDVTPEFYDALDALKEEPNHLIVRTFPDNDMLVQCTDLAYTFEYRENDGVLTLEWTIQNATGSQRIL